MKAKKSWGGDYECLKEWPTDAFLQCGDNGLVIGKNPYTTAFFEAFPKNPSTFIRGEGLNLELAEASAFAQYERIMACPQHEYKRRADSEHGNCIHCNVFTSHCFAPTDSCSVCNKPHINYSFNNNKLCREHFIDKVKYVQKDYNIDDNIPYQGICSDREMNCYYIEEMLFTELALKYQIINFNEPEYVERNRLNDLQNQFYLLSYNEFVYIHKEEKTNNPDKDFKISALSFPNIPRKLFFVPELYELVFKKYFKLDDSDIKNALTPYFYKMFERYKSNKAEV